MVELVNLVEHEAAISGQVAALIGGNDLDRTFGLAVLAQLGHDAGRPIGILRGAHHEQVIGLGHCAGAKSSAVVPKDGRSRAHRRIFRPVCERVGADRDRVGAGPSAGAHGDGVVLEAAIACAITDRDVAAARDEVAGVVARGDVVFALDEVAGVLAIGLVVFAQTTLPRGAAGLVVFALDEVARVMPEAWLLSPNTLLPTGRCLVRAVTKLPTSPEAWLLSPSDEVAGGRCRSPGCSRRRRSCRLRAGSYSRLLALPVVDAERRSCRLCRRLVVVAEHEVAGAVAGRLVVEAEHEVAGPVPDDWLLMPATKLPTSLPEAWLLSPARSCPIRRRWRVVEAAATKLPELQALRLVVDAEHAVAGLGAFGLVAEADDEVARLVAVAWLSAPITKLPRLVAGARLL